jgi:phosphoserine phosphatase
LRIAAFDLDGTLLSGNSSFLFCRYLQRQGVLSSGDLIYCAALFIRHLYFRLPLLDLHSLAFNRLFRGKSITSLSIHVTPFIQTLKWYGPALSRLRQLNAEGVEIRIFSNSPIFLVKPIAEEIGVFKVDASEYEIDNSGCLWNISSQVDGEKKQRMLLGMGEETLAFSDSHHDLPFLEAAARAVAVNPNRRLAKIARLRNWEIL